MTPGAHIITLGKVPGADEPRLKEQPSDSSPANRIAGFLDSWTKVLVALGGLFAAAVALVTTLSVLWQPDHDSAPGPAPTTGQPSTVAPRATARGISTQGESAAPVAGTLIGQYHNVELTNFYGFDMDADPPRVSQSSSVEFLEPIGDSPGYLQSADSQLVLLPAGSTGSYATCKSATRFTWQLSMTDLSVGSGICVTTPHHRIGLITVRRMPDPSGDAAEFIRLDITEWQDQVGP